MAVQRQDGWRNDARPGSVDLTGKERYLVTRNNDAALTVRLAESGEIVAGVLQEGKIAGAWSSFANGGLLKIVGGSAWTPGQRIQAGAAGTAVPGNTNSFGVSRNSGFSGELMEVEFDQS